MNQKTLEQGSDEWKQARLGCVTASRVADVMAQGKGSEAVTRQKYKLQIVAERLALEVVETYSNAAMEWGVEQEAFAVMAYEASNDVLTDRTGFWPHPSIPFIGASPDRLVGDDGLVEVKCPNTTTHLGYILDGVVPAQYVKQVQCQLWATGREWCDFVSFDPRLPKRNQLFVIRVFRDEELITKMEAEVRKFLAEVDFLITQLEK